MKYVLADKNGSIIKYPYTLAELRQDNQNSSIPEQPTAGQLLEFGVSLVTDLPTPQFDPRYQRLEQHLPVISEGQWVAGWSVIDLTVVEINQANEARRQAMVVTPFQAKAALLDADLLDDIEALIADPLTDRVVVLAWNNAIQFERLSPMVAGIAAALGWTDEQLDGLFEAAALKTA